jgi:hypothetical protein
MTVSNGCEFSRHGEEAAATPNIKVLFVSKRDEPLINLL